MNKLFNSIRDLTNFYFIRHGESVYNTEHIVAGQAETPLTHAGKTQAHATGLFLQDKRISCVLHSPLERTRDTAQIIHTHLKDDSIPIFTLDSLIEMDAGDFTHKKLADIQKENPTLYARFKIHSWEGVQNAEKISSLCSRCKTTWDTLLRYTQQGHANIALISHGGYLQWIFKTSFGMSGSHTRSWSPIVRTSNCGIYQLTIEPSSNNRTQRVFAYWNLLNYICYN